MAQAGDAIDETGLLVRDGAGFALVRDAGGRHRLDLHRVPIDLVEKRVRVRGVMTGDGRVDADGVAPA